MAEGVREGHGHPSLRARLLLVLMLPMLAVLGLFGATLYSIATRFDRDEHDRSIRQDAETLARLVQAEPTEQPLPATTQQLLSYDTDGRPYFAITSDRLGSLSGLDAFPAPSHLPVADGVPMLYDANIEGVPVRAAIARVVPPYATDDVLSVYWAETLAGEQRRAKRLLASVALLTAALATAILVLAWLGVNNGLRSLAPLRERLAARQRELSPVTDRDVPREILPLTRTIDALFARLQAALASQERFLADAAHQLRTPLAGIQLKADRALQSTDPAVVHDALGQIRDLTGRAGRTAGQLVALSRVESPATLADPAAPIDLASLARQVVTARIDDAGRAHIDLGYRGPETGLQIDAERLLVLEALDNLVDNALRYAGPGATVTVCVDDEPDGGSVWVEDNGPGVDAAALARLGERFYRPPGSPPGGSGLGLAIVRGIAAQLGARFSVQAIESGGLRVGLGFRRAAKG